MSLKDDCQDFKKILNDLKLNSKPLINRLTFLAEEKVTQAAQIVRAIEERVFEANGDQVLPVLYVLDSIVKNLRASVYVQLFESRLPILFSTAFYKVDERTRSAMFKLRQTWPPFFTNLCLYNVDTRTHDIDPAWPILARVPDPPLLPPPNSLQGATQNDEFHQQILRYQYDDADSSTFRTRTVNQPPISLAPPKLSELTSRADTYKPIAPERMEQIRQETSKVLDLGVDGEQQSKIRKLLTKKKKRRPSARLRRKAEALAQALAQHNEPNSSGESSENAENNDDDEDDEPFIIKKSSAVLKNGTNVDVLFGEKDKDYRESDVRKSPTPTVLDADSIFEINSKCLALAEKKYKAKEFSAEEYQATLKLLQNILESEVKRLTIQQTNHSLSGMNENLSSVSNSSPTNLPFQQQILQIIDQRRSPTAVPSPNLSSFSFSGFTSDAHRHVMQILNSVGAPSSYTSNYNFFSFVPPLPPAPPSFSMMSNHFSSPTSPTTKRLHDENETNIDDDVKRPRYDPVTGRETRTRNFDEENIAPIPTLVDANLNMLKKKYIGIVQQLYNGKYQCRLCGLRFTSKEKTFYKSHLDWHYLENRQPRSKRIRQWFPTVQEWTIYEENLDEQIRTAKLSSSEEETRVFIVPDGENIRSSTGIISCPASQNGDADDDRCFVCHDPFENFFDDNREEWHLKDAMRIDGKTYHPICYQDILTSKSDQIDPSTNASISNENDQLSTDSSLDQSTKSNEHDDRPTTDNDRTDPSTLSFVDIFQTIFVKKSSSSSSVVEEEIPF